MELSTSSEANSRSASQQIPRVFVEPDGSLSCSQDPVNESVLSLLNPIHALKNYF
jgi:hypothetical protein